MKNIVAMVDVARNSVLKKDEIKKFIDAIALMGYNSFALYIEDVFELKEYPMYGYLRGKYSVEDLKELVAYGVTKGITLIPIVELLAHLDNIFRWKDFKNIHDNKDILLVDEPATYDFIEAVIKTMREIYKTDRIMLGCDEAATLGLGQYLKKHGYTDQKEIFQRHLKKCVDIAHKYNFVPSLSGDMFFSLAGEQYTDNTEIITPEIASLFPKNAIFNYWDYFSPSSRIQNMITASKKFGAPIAFSASVCSWTGFTPHNYHSFDTNMRSLPVVLKEDIEEVHISHWGDDGGECSVWAELPAWFFCAQVLKGETDIDVIKKRFKETFDIDFDNFCKLDYPADYTGDLNNFYSSKVPLYSDPFLGIFDNIAVNGEEVRVRMLKHADELNALIPEMKEFGYLFDTMSKLCKVVAAKYDLGVRTREAYTSKDKAKLLKITEDYTLAYEKVSDFYESFRYLWYKERKGNGFEIQSARIGGVKQRLLDCKERIISYINGEIDCIEELEEPTINIQNIDDSHNLKINKYNKIASPNGLFKA